MTTFAELKQSIKCLKSVDSKTYHSIEDLKGVFYSFINYCKNNDNLNTVEKYFKFIEKMRELREETDYPKGSGLLVVVFRTLLDLYNKELPFYNVTENLFFALEKTELPKTIANLNPFVEKGIIFFPKTTKWKCFCFFVKVEQDSLKIQGFLLEKDYVFVQSVFYFDDTSLTDIQNDDQRSLLQFFVNLLLYKFQKKDNETLKVCPVKPMGFGKNTKQIIEPILIGKDYQPKIQTVGSAGGTHASPRTHWRMGHWRNQCCGSRDNPEHRPVWIEPVLVNP